MAATIGGMCYSIYLYHIFIIKWLLPHTLRLSTSTPVQVALYLPVCAVIGALLFLLFEKPFMYRDWHTRLWERLRGSRLMPPRRRNKPVGV